jgi:murein DD-endopeptidase MepM/ murein hydrolase activator NlpD
VDEICYDDIRIKPEINGVYHKVKKGETLFQIAELYKVPIEKIVDMNSIPDVARLEDNQLVFIPGANRAVSILQNEGSTEKGFIWPLDGKVVRYFRSRDGEGINKGIDIESKDASVVKAARSGRVVFADYLSGYGPTVILDHSDGYYTVYSFNSDFLVKLNEKVPQGAEIGKIKSANDRAYLHFEIRRNAVEDNPLYYLP